MVFYAAVIWIVGCVTLVPAAVHRLLFIAATDEYARLITFVLFWIFGFWGVAGPLISLVKIRRVFGALERARSSEEIRTILEHPESIELAVEAIARENRLPRFLVRLACRRLLHKHLTTTR